MSKTISDQIVDILTDIGVELIIGLPGDAVDLMLESLYNQDKIKVMITRHEQVAGHAAKAYAMLTGKLTVVIAAAGPGSANLLNAMCDAAMDGAPVLFLTGQVETDLIGTRFVQEINQHSIFESVAGFNQEARSAKNTIQLLYQAIAHSTAKNTASHLSVPTDMMRLEAVHCAKKKAIYDLSHTVIPAPELVTKAADLINSQKRITMLCGGGIKHAKQEVMEMAHKLNAVLVHTTRSKAMVDNASKHYCGGVGFKGSPGGNYNVNHCDLLIIIGCNFAWSEYYPEGLPIIQIDLDPMRIGLVADVEVGLVGHAKQTLQLLNKQIEQKTDDSFLKDAQARHEKALEKMAKGAQPKKHVISSATLTTEISKRMDDDAIVALDAGTISVFGNNFLRMNTKQELLVSTRLGTLMCSLGYAIGAKVAFPKRQALALTGDGGALMAIADFATAVKYELPIIMVVYNNFSYHFIELEQMKEGYAKAFTDLHNPDFAELAESFGGRGFTITENEQIGSTLDEAFACGKPSIINVHVDKAELIKPPVLKLEMVENFAKAKARGWLRKFTE